MSAEGQETNRFFYVLQDAVRILFVDDDPILREFALVHLSSDQADVTLAADGEEALARLQGERFDLALLDLEMPRMDGFEALARLRADEKTRTLPVIVVTGREDVGAIDRAFEAGATAFLVKPINWRLLSYEIRYLYRARQTELALTSACAEARARGDLTAAALKRLAQESSRLLQIALAEIAQAQGGPTGAGPELKRAAHDYAALLAEIAEITAGSS